MQCTTRNLVLVLATTVLAAPLENGKRQFDGERSESSFSGIALPTGGFSGSSGGLTGGFGSSVSGITLPTGGFSGSSGGLAGGSGASGALPSLGSGALTGSGIDSSGGDLSGFASSGTGITGIGTSGSDLSGLSESSSDLTPTATTNDKRQTFGSSGSSGFGSLPSGFGFGSGSSGFGTGTSGFGSGTSGLGSLSSSSSSLTGSSTASASSTSASGSSSGSGSGSCKALTFIFARGTGETGTLGTVIGAPVATALANKLGDDQVNSEGVDYPADAEGNANLGASGGPAMAKLANAALSDCPNTKVVLSGYSQGAMVVHNTLSDQGVDGSKIAAVVVFGDPENGQSFQGVDSSKVKEYCGSSDEICDAGGSDESGSHLSYGSDADSAVEFIISATGLSSS